MPKEKKPGRRHETPNNDDDWFEMYRWEFPESEEHQAKTNAAMSSFANFVTRFVAKIRRSITKAPLSREDDNAERAGKCPKQRSYLLLN